MIVVLGGGLAGLGAGYTLAGSGISLLLIEKEPSVGGLSRTVHHRGFRFDLGGHRFLTDSEELRSLIKGLLGNELLTVRRRSKIFINGKYIDYPLRPLNALTGLGPLNSVFMVADYLKEKLKVPFIGDGSDNDDILNLEQWVVRNFGRRIFELYFRDYSEKVWGRDCSEISKEWISQRINGLSLCSALKEAMLKRKNKGMRTLTDEFLYPSHGIGMIADRLKRAIEDKARILTNSSVFEILHDGEMVREVAILTREGLIRSEVDQLVSTIPLHALLDIMRPAPPAPVVEALERLSYRHLILVTLFLERDQATELTWLYFPDKDLPFGRLHEPKNWSPYMAPEGRTHLVVEFFCSEGDGLWSMSDEQLEGITMEALRGLGFFKSSEVMDALTMRIKNAYPIFDLAFRENLAVVEDYLKGFKNLFIAGRTGSFSYLNMDHALLSGMKAASEILRQNGTKEGSRKQCFLV